ncbi:glycosyltransferase family 4 protein [Acidithiobacillus sp. IBUN Pt1247-S3]|uniref:glycosyltransferase family 4 protein n=1 Tax=Acidithiobacillus sp. IBUN Pt1247-S3 TaxID=3166642 RepID=UPI0034E5CAE9
MRIALVTDAWSPQVNGVVRALQATANELRKLGHEVQVIHSGEGPTMPCPSYPEIPLATEPFAQIGRAFTERTPDAVHIATEGPLGLAARIWCAGHNWQFTTSFHTRFAEYLAARTPIPLAWSYAFLRWFHNGATHTLISNPALAEELEGWGFRHLAQWSRGVDSNLFRPWPEQDSVVLLPGARPAFVYFGRVAVEKNVEDFLHLDLPGSKHVIGDGPLTADLRARYSAVQWHGMMHGEQLSRHLAAADVMVFPSRTDTLGLVVREANACGVPVAAYPVTGPQASIVDGVNGFLREDLREAAVLALDLNRQDCRNAALQHSWERCTQDFINHLVNIQTD